MPRAATSVATSVSTLPELERGQRALALVLGLVAVHRDGAHALAAEALDEPVGAALGAHEHERELARRELLDERVEPRVAVDGAEAVLDLGRRSRRRRVLVPDRVGACRRHAMRPTSPSSVAEKNSVWRSAGHWATMPVDGGAEAHVEHAVGLVEDEDLDVAERERAALEQVLEAAGRRDHEVRGAGVLDLLVEADAAVDGGDVEAARGGQRARLLDDLADELARRGEHERGRAAGVRLEHVDDRRGERDRLARPRRGLGEHVDAVEDVLDDERLDGEGRGDAAVGERAHNGLRQAEIGEGLLGHTGYSLAALRGRERFGRLLAEPEPPGWRDSRAHEPHGQPDATRTPYVSRGD